MQAGAFHRRACWESDHFAQHALEPFCVHDRDRLRCQREQERTRPGQLNIRKLSVCLRRHRRTAGPSSPGERVRGQAQRRNKFCENSEGKSSCRV